MGRQNWKIKNLEVCMEVSTTRIHKPILKKLGSLFLNLAETSQDIFWIRSVDFYTHVYVSPAFENIFGISRQTLYANPNKWMNAVIIEDRDRLRHLIMEWQVKNKKGAAYTVDYRIIDAYGEMHWINETSYPVYEDDQCLGYAGVVKDVSSEKLRVKEFDNAVHYFRHFVERVSGVFWVKGSRGDKQIYISPTYEKIWGVSCESLYQNPKSWIDYVLPEDISNGKVNVNFYETAADQRTPDSKYEFRFRIRRPDGEIRWIKDTYFPIMENGKLVGFAGIAEDVTNDALREKELWEAKEFAEQANRTKSDFLAMMSHELRTPLNAILGMSQILKTHNLSDEQQGQIDVISQAGQNLLALLNDLLDFAKLEAGKLSFTEETMDLHELVMKIKGDMLLLAHKKGMQLKFDYPENIPSKVMGDAKRIRQVLVNLLSNALKFTEKGYVQLTANCLKKDHKKMTLCFTVKDTGIGMEKTKLSSIFNRFQQINSVYQRKYDGVGLGLSIVKELLEKMGGTISVTSEPGVGSEFTCIIPFRLQADSNPTLPARDLLEKQAVNNSTYDRESRFNMNVLVVEDNLINQRISKIMLEQVGCQVDIAGCGKDASEKMKKHYDMVFMDIGLPDMDGFETTQCIRHNETPGQRVPIVAMTAHVFAQDRKRCFDVGMDEVMAKPIMQDDLIKVLKRWAA
ncbi:PAS domain-containing protein [Coxiella burnetii]